jgi:hypothetical protein
MYVIETFAFLWLRKEFFSLLRKIGNLLGVEIILKWLPIESIAIDVSYTVQNVS